MVGPEAQDPFWAGACLEGLGMPDTNAWLDGCGLTNYTNGPSVKLIPTVIGICWSRALFISVLVLKAPPPPPHQSLASCLFFACLLPVCCLLPAGND